MSTERRPGDWICPSCDNNNFAHRDRCHLCHKPRESSSRHSPDRDRDRDRERERERDSRDDRDWICSGCDHRNHPRRSRCSRCDRHRSSSSSSSSSSRPNSYPSSVLPMPSYYPSAMPRGPLPSMRGPPPLAVPGMMGMLNPKAYAVPGMRPPGPPSAYQPSARGDPEVRPGDWRCRHCDSNNFARREHCFNCKASRADAEARYSKHHDSQSRMPMPVAPYAYAAYPASMYYNPSLYYMGAAAPSRLGLKRDRDEEESADYGGYRKRDRREDYDYHRDDRDYRRERERDREHDRERDHERERERERPPRERERESRRSPSPQRRSASPRNSSSSVSDLHHRHHSHHHHHHHHDDNTNTNSSNGHNNRGDSLSPPAGRSSRYSPAPVSPSLHSPLSSSHSREKRDHDDEDSAGFDELNDVL